jgi:hypothetical protein
MTVTYNCTANKIKEPQYILKCYAWRDKVSQQKNKSASVLAEG